MEILIKYIKVYLTENISKRSCYNNFYIYKKKKYARDKESKRPSILQYVRTLNLIVTNYFPNSSAWADSREELSKKSCFF